MTPAQLRTFLAVADEGSVQAAAALFVTHPAVSAVLASLRRELDVDLVERQGRGLRLTPAGTVLARNARDVLGLLTGAEVATRAEADPASAPLRIAAVTTAGESFVPRWLGSFLDARPSTEVSLEVRNRSVVWDHLERRQVDLVVAGRPPAGSGFASLAVRPHQLVVVSRPAARPGERRAAPTRPALGEPNPAPDDPIPAPGEPIPAASPGGRAASQRPPSRRAGRARRTVSREELAAATWLLREEGSGTRATAEELFGALEIRPQTLTLGYNGALREAVAVGLGVALLSRGAVREDLATDLLEEWSHPALPIEREWHLVAHDAARASRVVADFVSHAVAAGEAVAGRGTDPFRSQVGRGRARAQSSARYRRRASRPRDG